MFEYLIMCLRDKWLLCKLNYNLIGEQIIEIDYNTAVKAVNSRKCIVYWSEYNYIADCKDKYSIKNILNDIAGKSIAVTDIGEGFGQYSIGIYVNSYDVRTAIPLAMGRKEEVFNVIQIYKKMESVIIMNTVQDIIRAANRSIKELLYADDVESIRYDILYDQENGIKTDIEINGGKIDLRKMKHRDITRVDIDDIKEDDILYRAFNDCAIVCRKCVE